MVTPKETYNFASGIVNARIGEVFAELDKVKDVDIIPEFKGQTLLHFAVSQKEAWAIRALLQRGADPNLLTLNRNTALDIAVDPSSLASKEIIAMIEEKGGRRKEDLTIPEIHEQLEKKYRRVIAEKDPDMLLLKVLVRNHPQQEQGFVLDYMQRNFGYSPLHDAAQAGNVALLKFWLDIGLPPDLPTRGGKTAFDFEMQKENPNPEIFDVIDFYRRKRKDDHRLFFESGFIDEAIITIPENTTLDDLRKVQSTVATDTLLYRIARFGDVTDIFNVAVRNGQRLEEDDLLRPTHAWKSVLELAAERKQAEILLDPRLWKGRRALLQKLIEHLGPAKTHNIDTDGLLIEADRLALKDRAAKKGGYKL